MWGTGRLSNDYQRSSRCVVVALNRSIRSCSKTGLTELDLFFTLQRSLLMLSFRRETNLCIWLLILTWTACFKKKWIEITRSIASLLRLHCVSEQQIQQPAAWTSRGRGRRSPRCVLPIVTAPVCARATTGQSPMMNSQYSDTRHVETQKSWFTDATYPWTELDRVLKCGGCCCHWSWEGPINDELAHHDDSRANVFLIFGSPDILSRRAITMDFNSADINLFNHWVASVSCGTPISTRLYIVESLDLIGRDLYSKSLSYSLIAQVCLRLRERMSLSTWRGARQALLAQKTFEL